MTRRIDANGKVRTMTLGMPGALIDAVQAEADLGFGGNRSLLIRRAVEAFLEKQSDNRYYDNLRRDQGAGSAMPAGASLTVYPRVPYETGAGSAMPEGE